MYAWCALRGRQHVPNSRWRLVSLLLTAGLAALDAQQYGISTYAGGAPASPIGSHQHGHRSFRKLVFCGWLSATPTARPAAIPCSRSTRAVHHALRRQFQDRLFRRWRTGCRRLAHRASRRGRRQRRQCIHRRCGQSARPARLPGRDHHHRRRGRQRGPRRRRTGDEGATELSPEHRHRQQRAICSSASSAAFGRSRPTERSPRSPEAARTIRVTAGPQPAPDSPLSFA